jgi:glycosyltransferase involved in cell wall biosynthesis
VSPLHIVLLDYRDVTHPLAGGAEAYLNEIFQRVAARGHRVTLIAGRYRGARAEDRIGHLQVLRTGNEAAFNIVGARMALRVAQRQPVDVFVENICKIPYFLPAFTTTPVLPIVLHLFGRTVFHEVNPAFAAYVWLHERLIPRVYRGLRFVAISESTAQDLARRGLRTSRTDVVSPGLDLTRYRVDAAVGKSAEPLVVYLGMLKRYKGLDVVIRALAHARRAVPGARLVLLGKGNDRARLEALARSLGLAECVTFAGWVSDEEKIQWLRRAHAVVYPSRKEGWGIPTMEAAACGTPTLASDTDGLRDAVRDGVTGFLIPHTDVDAWARRLIAILTDAALCARMGTAARQWAQGFGWDTQAELMRVIVEEVAAGGLNPPVEPTEMTRAQRAE